MLSQRISIYSLSNPPRTPRKKAAPVWRTWALVALPLCPDFAKEEEEEKVFLKHNEEIEVAEVEREVLESWAIRPRYLNWTPSEVALIDSEITLMLLYKKHTFPKSQPRNTDEIVFHQMMMEAILDRMTTLNLQDLLYHPF